MKRLSVGSAALLVVLSTTAFAVDMTPVFKTLPNDSATRDWAGVYGRMSTGQSWNGVTNDGTLHGTPFTSGTLTPESYVGNGQFGYNMQMGPLVFGLETDIAWRRGVESTVYFAPSALDTMSLRGEQGWVGTLRPRVGVTVDNWLLYGTGGVAYGSLSRYSPDGGTGVIRPGTDTKTNAGWTVGAGLEFAGGQRWSLGLEYLYTDFGKINVNQAPQGNLPLPAGTFQDQFHLLRGKFNYNFDWNAPLKK
jgi:outer membrane immunogenic protein